MKTTVYDLNLFIRQLLQEKPAHKFYLARVNVTLVTETELNGGSHLPEGINQPVK